MSKIVEKYLRLKEENGESLYLFHSGNFYIFIGDDADYVSNYLALKKTSFSKDYEKCGFPASSLEKYKKAFELHSWDVVIVEEFNPKLELKSMDIDKVTLKEAKDFLRLLKEYYETN